MKIKYEFVTGEVTEIEVTGEVADALCSMENSQQHRERAETRRHDSLDALTANGVQFACSADTQVEAMHNLDVEALRAALPRLSPAQQRLVRLVYFEGQSISDIARAENVSHVAVIDRLRRVNRALKKSLE